MPFFEFDADGDPVPGHMVMTVDGSYGRLMFTIMEMMLITDALENWSYGDYATGSPLWSCS